MQTYKSLSDTVFLVGIDVPQPQEGWEPQAGQVHEGNITLAHSRAEEPILAPRWLLSQLVVLHVTAYV